MYYDPVDTGKRVQNLRKEKELTQEQLSEKLNITTDYLGKIETGRRGCSIEVLIDIALFFDVSLDYLVLGKPMAADLRQQMDSALHVLEDLRKKL